LSSSFQPTLVSTRCLSPYTFFLIFYLSDTNQVGFLRPYRGTVMTVDVPLRWTLNPFVPHALSPWKNCEGENPLFFQSVPLAEICLCADYEGSSSNFFLGMVIPSLSPVKNGSCILFVDARVVYFAFSKIRFHDLASFFPPTIFFQIGTTIPSSLFPPDLRKPLASSRRPSFPFRFGQQEDFVSRTNHLFSKIPPFLLLSISRLERWESFCPSLPPLSQKCEFFSHQKFSFLNQQDSDFLPLSRPLLSAWNHCLFFLSPSSPFISCFVFSMRQVPTTSFFPPAEIFNFFPLGVLALFRQWVLLLSSSPFSLDRSSF